MTDDTYADLTKPAPTIEQTARHCPQCTAEQPLWTARQDGQTLAVFCRQCDYILRVGG